MEKYDVFISYTRKNIETSERICLELAKRGISYWIDRKALQMGDTWASEIMRAITNSTVFLIICSEDSFRSVSVLNELKFATQYNKPILPLMIDGDYRMPSEWEFYLGPIKRYSIEDENWMEVLERLVLNEVGETGMGKVETRSDGSTSALSCATNMEADTDDQQAFTTETVSSMERKKDKASVWKARRLSDEKKDALLKLACDRQSIVYLDGEYLCDIGEKEVVMVPLECGSYILSFVDKQDPDSCKTMAVEIEMNHPSKSVVMEMPQSNAPKREPLTGRNELKCFIAGSKTLITERMVMRSVVSNMYVRWKSQNLLIEAYSFDNFPHTVSDSGHQEEYNQFIDNEADLVLFLFDKIVGENTLKELDIALNSYRDEKRPKIIIYVKDGGKKCEAISTLKKRLLEEDIYWVDYNNLDSLAMAFEKDLNDLIVNKVYIENVL